MILKDILKFDFVTFDGYRFKINPSKAVNTLTLNAVLTTLKNEGYSFYRLFSGGCIFAEKQKN